MQVCHPLWAGVRAGEHSQAHPGWICFQGEWPGGAGLSVSNNTHFCSKKSGKLPPVLLREAVDLRDATSEWFEGRRLIPTMPFGSDWADSAVLHTVIAGKKKEILQMNLGKGRDLELETWNYYVVTRYSTSLSAVSACEQPTPSQEAVTAQRGSHFPQIPFFKNSYYYYYCYALWMFQGKRICMGQATGNCFPISLWHDQ